MMAGCSGWRSGSKRACGDASTPDGQRSVPGQSNGEDRAPARAALHGDGAAVCLGNPLGDRETEAGPRTIARARARRIGPPEAVENVRQITRSDADARIAHGDADRLLVVREGEVDGPALRCVLDR